MILLPFLRSEVYCCLLVLILLLFIAVHCSLLVISLLWFMYLFYWKVLPFLHCGLLLAIAAYCPWLIDVYLNNVFLFMGLNLLLCIVRYCTLLTPSYCGLSNSVIGWYCFVSMVDYYCLLGFIASWLLLCIGSKYWVLFDLIYCCSLLHIVSYCSCFIALYFMLLCSVYCHHLD